MKKSLNKIIIRLLICILIIILCKGIVYYFSSEKNAFNRIRFNVTQYAISLFTLYLLIFTIIIYLIKKIRYPTGEYERNPENVINPILAESLIDGKIDGKNLIMTCITNLINHKNLEIIDKDSFKLVKSDGIIGTEKTIILALYKAQFPEEAESDLKAFENRVFVLSELKNVFSDNKSVTLEFFNRIRDVKKEIIKELDSKEIISKFWGILLRLLRTISVLIIINTIFMVPEESIFNRVISEMRLLNIILFIVIYYFDIDWLINSELSKVFSNIIFIKFFYLYVFLISIILAIVSVGMPLLVFKIVIIIINIMIIKLTNIFVLTKKGKEEYKKAAMLKNYLIDYSLINQRDIDGVIIYDDYLVYATAFGLSSKVTSKMNEELINLNITVQIIDKAFEKE